MTQQSQRLWGHATVVAQARPPSHMYVHQYQRITLGEVATSSLAAPSLLSPHTPLVLDCFQGRPTRWKMGRGILSTFFNASYMCFWTAKVTGTIMDARALAPWPASSPQPASSHSSPRSALPSQGAAGAGLFRPLDHAGVEFGVAAGMLGEVVAPHEPLLAEGAPELLLTSVGSVVPCELVRAGELFKAVRPRAGEWSLTCREERITRELGGQG